MPVEMKSGPSGANLLFMVYTDNHYAIDPVAGVATALLIQAVVSRFASGPE